MSGLVIKLAPGEKILINGAIVENGDRRSRINILTENANVLRLRDAIHPENANTPVARLCYSLQLMLTGDTSIDELKVPFYVSLERLSHVFTDIDSRSVIADATSAFHEANYYRCLKKLRSLLPREARLMALGAA